MPERICLQTSRSSFDADLAESIIMNAYVQLPSLPRQPDGCWVAPLVRNSHHEVRLIERVPASSGEAVLRVELLNRATESILVSRTCEEIEDAVVAFSDILGYARDWQPGCALQN